MSDKKEIKYGQLWARHSVLVEADQVGTYRITFEGLKEAVDEALLQNGSPSKEGDKEGMVAGLALLKWLNENDWSGVGSGEYINSTNGRIIKEARLLREFNEWNNQQQTTP